MGRFNYPQNNEVEALVIASGQSLSPAIFTGGYHAQGFMMPDTWTAADLTFQASMDNGLTFKDIYDAQGTEYKVTAAGGRYIILDPVLFGNINCFKVRSGTSGTPVTQAAARSITVNMG